jgi:hypothetical protein
LWAQDADNPNRTSLRRLFLFEVEQMADPDGGISVAPVVRLFQALSPADMDQWKVRASVKYVVINCSMF